MKTDILVQTCCQAKDSGLKLLEVHSANKGINPDLKPERQALKSQNSANKSRLGTRERRTQDRNESPNTRTSASAN